ncbi:MAG: folate family ECF transporter S component [Anaerovoracaceae bacterium]
MRNNSRLTKMVIVGLFIALEIILTRFCSINTPIIRIGFGFLPVAMLAIMFGPLWAGVAYAIGDILGMMIFPSGQYFPGFTLTAFLTGLIFGLVLYNKKITYVRSFFAALVVCGVLNLCLDTLWLYILTGQGILALLPARLLKVAIAIPIQTILITTVWNGCVKKVAPQFAVNTNNTAEKTAA